MVRILVLWIIFVVLFSACSNSNRQQVDKHGNLKGNISISGAFALYPLAVKWAEEFKKENPNVNIDISAGGAGKGMTDVLTEMVDIGMVSRDIYKEEESKGAYAIAVTIDAVVPIINSNNALLKDINAKGLTRKDFQKVFLTNDVKTWGEILDNKSSYLIKAYTRSDAAGAPEVWAKYMGGKQEDLKGVGVFGDPGIANAIKTDKSGIGYANIAFVYNVASRTPIDGISVVPIDLNENGQTDEDENFYGHLDSLVQAISMGVYPSPPSRPLYFVTKGNPDNLIVNAFLKWVLSKGQDYVLGAGYIPLQKEELAENLKKLK